MFLLVLWIPTVLYLSTCCDLSNNFVQEVFLDRELGVDTSKELKKGEYGEEEEKVNVEKKLKRRKLGRRKRRLEKERELRS